MKKFYLLIVGITLMLLSTSCSVEEPGKNSNSKGSVSTLAAAVTIPGRVEAENYSAMSRCSDESCSEGTLDVGWITMMPAILDGLSCLLFLPQGNMYFLPGCFTLWRNPFMLIINAGEGTS